MHDTTTIDFKNSADVLPLILRISGRNSFVSSEDRSAYATVYLRALVIVFHWTLFDLPGPEEDGEGVTRHRAKVVLGEFTNGLDKLSQLRCLYLKAPNFLPEAAPASSTIRSTRTLRKLTLD